MLRLSPDRPSGEPLRVLCLGAHSDDVEIGCGGLVRRLVEGARPVHVRWVVFSAPAERTEEARASAADFLAGAAQSEVEVLAFRESFFPAQWSEIKIAFEGHKSFAPDLVLTHRRRDEHQDHRTLAELTWNTFRNHLVLEYEIAKYEGDLGRPEVFVPLTAEQVEYKVRALQQHFASQRSRSWFDESTFRGLMRIRGVECNAPSGYAEAFHGRKLVLNF